MHHLNFDTIYLLKIQLVMQYRYRGIGIGTYINSFLTSRLHTHRVGRAHETSTLRGHF